MKKLPTKLPVQFWLIHPDKSFLTLMSVAPALLSIHVNIDCCQGEGGGGGVIAYHVLSGSGCQQEHH